MTRTLVTGAGGYIGMHVVRALRERGAEVVAVDRPGRPRGADISGVTYVEADIFGDVDALLAATGPVDSCVHLAWEAGFVHNDPVHMLRLSDHFRFLDGLASSGVGQITVLGTMHEVGYFEGMITAETPTNPRSLYGVAKNALREALELRFAGGSTVFQWLRCFYIHGDDSRSRSIFSKIADAAADGQKTFPFTSGRSKYDFIEVGELAEQIAAAALQSEVTGIIHCCSGEPISLADRVEAYIAENGFAITLEYGAFPDRDYDSPAVWGDATKIRAIVAGTPDGAVV